MNANEYLRELNTQMSYLYSFSRKINELDFAASLSGEFRGAQDDGWATTITANEVLTELIEISKKAEKRKSELRVILMLYCQLSEAGGVYETLKNIMGVVARKPYVLWPFQDLVKIKKNPKRIIGPNANATFRNLANVAESIGLVRLSELLERTFRDDIRNGISHADYVIWNDGLRLRNRNGGYAKKVSFEDLGDAVTKAIAFFEVQGHYKRASVMSFNPGREIVGKFSDNPPMPWTVSFDPDRGSFSLSSSSPGSVQSTEYKRQVAINEWLGGKVMSVFTTGPSGEFELLEKRMQAAGFDPNHVEMDESSFAALIVDVAALGLWDERKTSSTSAGILLASPWGFRWILEIGEFDDVLPKPLVDIEISEGQ